MAIYKYLSSQPDTSSVETVRMKKAKVSLAIYQVRKLQIAYCILKGCEIRGIF